MDNTRIIYLIITCFLFGCYKKNGDGDDVSKCQIQTFYFNDTNSGAHDSIVFTYNNLGNPVAGIRSNVATGNPNFIFLYDEYNRLKELIGLYDTANVESAENWHNYFYDEYGRIIKDSLYYVPEVVNGRPLNKNVVTISFEYDSKNRIGKATTLFFGATKIISYTYDKSGNRDRIPYDDKINFHRTNKIWMFLDKEYSNNNPTNATYGYNEFNLPTEIISNPGTSDHFLDFGEGFLYFDRADIKYICK